MLRIIGGQRGHERAFRIKYILAHHSDHDASPRLTSAYALWIHEKHVRDVRYGQRPEGRHKFRHQSAAER